MSMTEPLIPMASRGVILQTKEKMERVGTRLQKKTNQQICQKPGLVILTDTSHHAFNSNCFVSLKVQELGVFIFYCYSFFMPV